MVVLVGMASSGDMDSGGGSRKEEREIESGESGSPALLHPHLLYHSQSPSAFPCAVALL